MCDPLPTIVLVIRNAGTHYYDVSPALIVYFRLMAAIELCTCEGEWIAKDKDLVERECHREQLIAREEA